MKGSDLVFAKAWSEIAVESPVVLPWDRSCWKHIVAGKSLVSLKPAVFKRSLPPTVLHESLPEVQPDKKHRSQGVSATSWIQVVKAGSEDNWTELRDAQFQTALKRWLDVLLQLPGSCLIVVQLNQFGSVTEQLRMLRDVFAKKAPQTLLKRCHSFLRFVCNLKETGEIFPGTEHGLYTFLCKLRDAGAPTSNLQSIIQALNFAQHVLGLQELSTVTMSRRCIGAVGARNVGPKRQAHPFKVVEMMALHSILLTKQKIPGIVFFQALCSLPFTAAVGGWTCNMPRRWRWTQIFLGQSFMWNFTFLFTSARSRQHSATLF
jgi:hypothetical protein